MTDDSRIVNQYNLWMEKKRITSVLNKKSPEKYYFDITFQECSYACLGNEFRASIHIPNNNLILSWNLNSCFDGFTMYTGLMYNACKYCMKILLTKKRMNATDTVVSIMV